MEKGVSSFPRGFGEKEDGEFFGRRVEKRANAYSSKSAVPGSCFARTDLLKGHQRNHSPRKQHKKWGRVFCKAGKGPTKKDSKNLREGNRLGRRKGSLFGGCRGPAFSANIGLGERGGRGK